MKKYHLGILIPLVFALTAQAEARSCARKVAAQLRETNFQGVGASKVRHEDPEKIIRSDLSSSDAAKVRRAAKKASNVAFYNVVVTDSYFTGASDTYLAVVNETTCDVLGTGLRISKSTHP